MINLKPCPFCGGEAELCYSEVDTFCRKCNVIQETEMWNTRPIEDELRARIAELEAESERFTVHSRIKRQDDKWIPVSERLPEERQEIVAVDKVTRRKKCLTFTKQGAVEQYLRLYFDYWIPIPHFSKPPEAK